MFSKPDHASTAVRPYWSPQTLVPSHEDEAEEFADKLGIPCLAKPTLSHRWAAVSKSKVLIVLSRQEAVQRYLQMQQCNAHLILQEYIEGPDSELYGALTYVGRTGRTLAAFTKQKLHQFPEQFGNGSVQVSIHNPALQELAADIFAKLGYRGFGSIEFKRDPQDGRLKVIELNPRTVSGLQMAVDSGCDMPWMAYCDITGAEQAPSSEFQEGVRFVNIAWELQRVRYNPSRSPAKWLRFALEVARGRSFAALSLRDPGPAISLIKRAMR